MNDKQPKGKNIVIIYSGRIYYLVDLEELAIKNAQTIFNIVAHGVQIKKRDIIEKYFSDSKEELTLLGWASFPLTEEDKPLDPSFKPKEVMSFEGAIED
jgi:hypothetical protein